MKMEAKGIGLIAAVACSICLADLAPAQVFRGKGTGRSSGFGISEAFGVGTIISNDGQNDGGYGNYPRSGAQTGPRSMTIGAGSRSKTFFKNGRAGSTSETAAGITVSVDGQTVRAKDVTELKNRYPDASRSYDEGLWTSQATAGAFAGGASSQSGSPRQLNANSSHARSISIMENGKKVSITENEKGIAVSVNGRRVREKDADKLKKRFPEAFKMYERYVEEANLQIGKLDAKALLQNEVGKLRDQNAGSPELRSLIETMMGK